MEHLNRMAKDQDMKHIYATVILLNNLNQAQYRSSGKKRVKQRHDTISLR